MPSFGTPLEREGRRPNQQPGKKLATDQMADMQTMVQNSMGMMLNMRMMDMMGNMMGSMGNSMGNHSRLLNPNISPMAKIRPLVAGHYQLESSSAKNADLVNICTTTYVAITGR